MTLRGEWTLPADARFFEGHFPDRPILPAIAQLWLLERLLERTDPRARITGVENVKFSRAVGPEARLTFEIEPTAGEGRGRFSIHDDTGQRVANGKLTWSRAV